MDRKLARRNMAMGISMFVVLIAIICATFVWASLFLAVVK